MSKINIRTKSGIFEAELDDSDISNTIWLTTPHTADTNMLGNEIYFELPLDCKIEGEEITELENGDVAYWPKAKALCIFFGATPLSGENGNPVSPYPVIKIGKLLGEYSELENSGDRCRIVIERP